MFQSLQRLGADSILGLMTQYRADPSAQKVDLGVGVYRDLNGNTPILECVRRTEQRVLSSQTSKSYVGPAGREEFNAAVQELVLGSAVLDAVDGRANTVQAPGGCGALRVGAELIHAAAPSATVHVSDPTWGNHVPLLGSSGLKLATGILTTTRPSSTGSNSPSHARASRSRRRPAMWCWCTPVVTTRAVPISMPKQWAAH